MSHTPEELQNNERLTQAILYAAQCHTGQFRKGSARPYILHPMEVVQILNAMGADTDLLMAGILHDTVEDTAATLQDILDRFGPQVHRLVAAHTEDKTKSWKERKEADIRAARRGDKEVKLLILADKVSNLRSMVRDRAQVGEALWRRFKAPKEAQSKYYADLWEALGDLQFEAPAIETIYWEMDALYKELFVRFAFDRDRFALYRRAAHGEGAVLRYGDPRWHPWDAPLPAGATTFSRENAEELEDHWAHLLAEEDDSLSTLL